MLDGYDITLWISGTLFVSHHHWPWKEAVLDRYFDEITVQKDQKKKDLIRGQVKRCIFIM
jgi:hypothetical protein